jgi:hypothetical protein
MSLFSLLMQCHGCERSDETKNCGGSLQILLEGVVSYWILGIDKTSKIRTRTIALMFTGSLQPHR